MIDAFLRDQYRLLPDGLRRAALVRRRVRLRLKAGIVFIHIPRAAGTSINHALYGRFMGHVRASDIRRWAPSDVKALPSFAVTRNPWDRLVSAYRFARRGHGVGGKLQAGLWRPEQYRIPQFDTFERFVTDWLAERDVRTLDGIFQPQHMFVCDSVGNVLVDHIGRLDDLRPTLEFIRHHIGTAPRVDQSNRSGERLDYKQFYAPKLTKIIAHIYREDIERFGYMP